jgi:septation ring formation regulator EzrA
VTSGHAAEVAALKTELDRAKQGAVDPSELTTAQQSVKKLETRVEELVKKLGVAVEARHAAEKTKSGTETELAKVRCLSCPVCFPAWSFDREYVLGCAAG